MIAPDITINAPPQQDEIQRLYKWIYDHIKAFVKGRILEVESGTNSVCSLFLDRNRPIHLSDEDPKKAKHLLKSLAAYPALRNVHNFNFTSPDFVRTYPETRDVFDTVIALNMENAFFKVALNNAKYVLPKGGILAVILPAYTSLYHGLDANLDDWKQFNQKAIIQAFKPDFSILKERFFNLMPGPESSILKHSGLSVLAIARKN